MSAVQHDAGVAAAPEPSSLRLVGTLGLAGLLSGLILVAVYELTLPIIEANNARALREAVFQVLPGTVEIRKLSVQGAALAEADDDAEGPAIYGGLDDGGALVGYAIPAAGNGFQDVIRVIYGYDPVRRQVVGFQVLESRETPGLGDKIFKDQAFLDNFDALAVDPQISAVPKGAKQAANEVDCITGATISSKAVVRILNAGNAQWLPRLPEAAAQGGPEEGR